MNQFRDFVEIRVEKRIYRLHQPRARGPIPNGPRRVTQEARVKLQELLDDFMARSENIWLAGVGTIVPQHASTDFRIDRQPPGPGQRNIQYQVGSVSHAAVTIDLAAQRFGKIAEWYVRHGLYQSLKTSQLYHISVTEREETEEPKQKRIRIHKHQRALSKPTKAWQIISETQQTKFDVLHYKTTEQRMRDRASLPEWPCVPVDVLLAGPSSWSWRKTLIMAAGAVCVAAGGVAALRASRREVRDELKSAVKEVVAEAVAEAPAQAAGDLAREAGREALKLVPFVGDALDIVEGIRNGDAVSVCFGLGGLGLSAMSCGAGGAVVKGIMKAGTKAVAKQTVKAGAKQVTKRGVKQCAKKAAKGAGKEIIKKCFGKAAVQAAKVVVAAAA